MQIAIEALRRRVRQREQRCVEQLLQLHRFSHEECQAVDLPLHDGRWGVDLFSPAAMKQFGLRTGGAVAAGAVAGLTIDAMVGGITLGAATVLGAAVGGALGLAQTHGRRLIDRIRGRSELAVDDATIRLLMMRQTMLLSALLRRGHASLEPIRLVSPAQSAPQEESSRERSSPALPALPRRLPAIIDEIRLHASWSRLQPDASPMAISSAARQNAQQRLGEEVVRIMSHKAT